MKQKLFYWVPTSLFLFFMVASAVNYFVNIETATKDFEMLGYPGYVLYFNGIAKILGAIAIIFPQVPRILKEWAYAGYLFIMLLAAQALYINMPQMAPIMLVFLALWGLSYWRFRAQYPK